MIVLSRRSSEPDMITSLLIAGVGRKQVRWRLMAGAEGSNTMVLRVMMVGCSAAQSFPASLSEKEKKHFGDGSSGGKGL